MCDELSTGYRTGTIKIEDEALADGSEPSELLETSVYFSWNLHRQDRKEKKS